MIEIDISPNQLAMADQMYDFKKLNGSITDGESQIYGAIGEVIALDFLKQHGTAYAEQDYDHDLRFDNILIDVKTKRTTVKPMPEYLASVADFNTRQKCDWYLFCRVLESKKKGWLCGFMWKTLFYKKAEFAKKGDNDPQKAGWKFKGDCYNLQYKHLIPLESIKG